MLPAFLGGGTGPSRPSTSPFKGVGKGGYFKGRRYRYLGEFRPVARGVDLILGYNMRTND